MSDDEFSEEYNSDEEFDFDDVDDTKTVGVEISVKVSAPIMWEYEKANIITARKDAIDAGSPTLLDDVGDLVSSYDIALREFDEGKIDYQLIRYVGKNFEIWKHSDFVYFPK